MTRRCSHCSHNGHNSRTCPHRPGGGGSGSGGGGNGQGVKLFGVRLVEASPMKKSASMGCLMHYSSLAAAGDSPSSDLVGEGAAEVEASGYASDDPNRASCSSNRRAERKKGTPWTEEEHRKFLLGLQTLGKGDWRGISRKFVVTRTPTQVASHAQKYFIRQTNTTRRRRRSSLFDMPVDHATVKEERFLPVSASTDPELHSEDSHPSLDLDLSLKRKSSVQDTATDKPEIEPNAPSTSLPPIVPAYHPAYLPVPFQYWSQNVCMVTNTETVSQSHMIVKPTPVFVKEPSSADEVVAMSNLRIGEAANGCTAPSALSSQVIVASASRPSAFHATPAAAAPDVSSSNSSVIHAV